MTESSVIKHYKKQLINRQHDVPDQTIEEKESQHVKEPEENGIHEFGESDARNAKKIRKKRKNRNCRGQFRHEGMELIKLGTNTSHSLCKTKEPYNARLEREKPAPEPVPPKEDQLYVKKAEDLKEKNKNSVIQGHFVAKTPILENPPPNPPLQGHALPQMVPERRNSREMNLRYRSPPHVSDYPVPIHPTTYIPPYPPPIRPYALPPPYSFHIAPPRPVPRPLPPQYPGIAFPFTRHPPPRPPQLPPEYLERKKRKLTPPIVAAIDLTVDQNSEEKHHKCQCECGKTYTSDPVSKEVLIAQNSQVPSYLRSRGKMVNRSQPQKPPRNGTVRNHHEVTKPPSNDKDVKVPQLFLIKDLLAKGVRMGNKSSHRIEETKKSGKEEKTIGSDVPIRTEPNRVIVSNGRFSEEPTVRPKSHDHSVSSIIGTNTRRQSVDIDTISISSSSSESVRSPRPKSDSIDKQIPRGKLFFYKANNSFIRYFDDSQKKLFMSNLIADGNGELKATPSDDTREIIELPRNAIFSCKDSLTVEEYVIEMTLAEKYIPKDFFLFYKFVTGYQICNNNHPVSFLTFLKIYNTNGLKLLYDRYVS